MKKLLALSLAFGSAALALGQDQELELNDLAPPSFPAATIMGVQPMEIVKPRSYNELETALINNFTEGGAVLIPNDFAMEVMPSWLAKPASKRFVQADQLDQNKFNFKNIVWDNLAISIASVNENIGDTSFNSKLGFGLRTKILEGKLSNSTKEKIALKRVSVMESQAIPLAIKDAIVDAEDGITEENGLTKDKFADLAISLLEAKNLSDSATLRLIVGDFWREIVKSRKPLNKAGWLAVIEKFKAKANQLSNTEGRIALAKELADLRGKRTGLIWEVAAATFIDFPTGTVDYSDVPKVGVWTTVSYTEGKGMGDFSLLVRYINDLGLARSDTSIVNSYNLDIGFRASLNVKSFTLAAEGLMRWKTIGASFPGTTQFGTGKINYTQKDYRLAINASYAFGNKLSIGYTFGKNFDFTEGSDLNLINQLSLNYAFGSVPIKF